MLLVVHVLEPLHEYEVGNLFNRRERICQAARVEYIPEFIDFAFYFMVGIQHNSHPHLSPLLSRERKFS